MSRRRVYRRNGDRIGALRIGSLIVVLAQASVASAQYTDSKCTSNTTNAWIFNEARESPCTVWSKLQYLCLKSVVNVPALKDSSWSYNAPAAELATQCSCNDVAFNLMAACAWCQVSQQGLDPLTWKASCGESYEADGLGFSEAQVAIPPFAWAPVKSGGWNAAAASAGAPSYTAYPTTTYSSTIARAFSTDIKVGSVTKGTATSASATSTETSSDAPTGGDTSDEPDGEQKKSNVGAIVGGVAGGLIAIVGIALLVLKLMRRREPDTIIRADVSSPQPNPADGRNLHKSFIDGFGQDLRQSYASDDTERADKGQRLRQTELFNLPASFSEPRPAPPAPGKRMSRFMSGLSRASMPARVRSGYIKTSDKGAGTYNPGAGRTLTPSPAPHLSHLPPPPGMRDQHMSYGFTPSPTEHAGANRDTLSGDRITVWTEDEDYYSDEYSTASGQPGRGPRTTRTLPSLYDPGTAGGRNAARTTMATDSVYSKYVTNPDPADGIPPVPRR